MKKAPRVLTAQEKERAEHLIQIEQQLSSKGYRRRDLTISMVVANIMALVFAVPFIAGFGVWFYLRNGFPIDFNWYSPLLLFAVQIALIFVHEGLHGLTWGIFAQHHFHSISFGFIKESTTPYCTCRDPLKKGSYLLGSLMPFLLLGLIPCIAGVLCNSVFLLANGLLSIIGAGGDLTVSTRLIFTGVAPNSVLMDHPTECGLILFEKQS